MTIEVSEEMIFQVIIEPRNNNDSDGWSDMPSIYIEQVSRFGAVRSRLSSDLATLSEYEIEADPAWEIDRNKSVFESYFLPFCCYGVVDAISGGSDYRLIERV